MKQFSNIVVVLSVILCLVSCKRYKKDEQYLKNKTNLIAINTDDDISEIVRKSTQVVPSDRQYAWQQLEFIAFAHTGPNTFTGVEWGTGKENPNVFNPTHFDARQWISVIKKAGMKMLILTAKHHDGFCLWPTTTTEHSVKSSIWKNGKGDMLKELADAAKEQQIKIGIYLSPADLHEIERKGGTYGNGSKPKMVRIPSDPELQKQADTIFTYSLDDYNTLFMNQLYEVLTQYGSIEEVWFDGANPKPGTGQTYNKKAWYDMIRKLQPNAVIAISGPDVRWCGNEAGKTRESEWSVIPLSKHPENDDWPDMYNEDLGSRNKLKDAKYLYWYPAETNTSIRSGWFYRDEHQYVKTVEELLDIWYRSVGGNTVFLLNLTPNRAGRIPEKDAKRLIKLGEIIQQSFADNLCRDAEVTASESTKEHPVQFALDDNPISCWKPKDGTEVAEFIVDLKKEIVFNRLLLQENIKNYGQRIEAFALDIWADNKWEEIMTNTTVGYKRICRFPIQRSSKIRLRILSSRICPTISFLGLYKAPEVLSMPTITRNKQGMVSLVCVTPDPKIHYTLDGTKPSDRSPLYTTPFSLPQGGRIKAVAFIEEGTKKSEVVTTHFDICAAKWKAVKTSSAHKGYEGDKAIDSNPHTLWHTPWKGNIPNHPHSITIDLGEPLLLKGFTYLPRIDGSLVGICKTYRIEVSLNGEKWSVAKTGEFGNIKNNPTLQEVFFSKTFKGRFIKFTALSSVNNVPYLSLAELGIITQKQE